MTREQKIAKASDLQRAGFSLREIGLALGYDASPASSARYWLRQSSLPKECAICDGAFTPDHGRELFCSDDCRAEAENLRKRRCEGAVGRGSCRDCGGPMAAGSAWSGQDRCIDCRISLVKSQRSERRAEIEALYNDGLTRREIAERLNSTANAVGTEISFMRRDGGYDLPYRRNESAPTFPEQVAA